MDILGSLSMNNGRSMHVATLSEASVAENDAEHLGFDGYFLFEADDEPGSEGITVLGKFSCFDTAMHLVEAWSFAQVESAPNSV